MSRPTVLSSAILEIDPPLEVPQQSPRVGINDPGFKKLTTAEKLNDSNYRKLVYQTHPDERTCECEPAENQFHERQSSNNCLVCRSGCNNVCCWRMKQLSVASCRLDNANENDNKVVPFVPVYCAGNKRNDVSEKEEARKAAAAADDDVHNGDYCCGNSRRLRGGGEGGEESGENGMYTRYGRVRERMMLGRSMDGRYFMDDCIVGRRRRLAGGGAFEYAERLPLYKNQTQASKALCCNEEPRYRQYPGERYSEERGQRSNHNGNDHYGNSGLTRASISTRNESIDAACVCPGREALTGRRNVKREAKEHLGKKDLPVIDCLVKAFKETQDFVESLGKVPGLAGLGLMDPAESPYFGRTKTKESDLDGAERTTNKAMTTAGPTGLLPNPQCTGPCNAEAIRSTNDESSVSPLYASSPTTMGLSGRGGVVREAVPSMPEQGLTFPAAKFLRRKDDKSKELDPIAVPSFVAEPSPCGEPLCAAKRRKAGKSSEDPLNAVADETISVKKSVTLVKPGERKISRLGHSSASQKFHSGRKITNTMNRSVEKIERRRSSGRSGRRIMSFVYTAGDTYTGEAYSHKNCVDERQRVPGNMGWLWNLNETTNSRLKPRQGWRPGAIGRHLREILRESRANYTKHLQKSRSKSSRSTASRSRSRSAQSRGKRGKAHGYRSTAKKKLTKNKREDKEELVPPPTLHIRRKDGTYYVTMYPIKQETMDVPKLEVPMKPLQFKIAKNKDDASSATSTTASDMEIEFSPPAAVNRYRKKPNVVHVDTQVRRQEIIDALKIDDAPRMKNKKKTKKKKLKL